MSTQHAEMADQRHSDRSDVGSTTDALAPRVSAIVVSYFTGPLLARALASLQAQPQLREIILVDNGNWPGAIDEAVAAAQGPADIRVLTGHGNIGFARACNLGARQASEDYLLLLNPDAILSPDALGQLISDGAVLTRPWLIGPKLVDPDGVEQQGSRRATLTPWRAFVEVTKLYRYAPRHPYFRRFNLHAEPCPEKLKRLPTVSGACMFLPRADYEAIGGMDERYFLHVEDVDFCLRFTEAGGDVYFDPHVSVTHFKSSSRVNAIRVERRKTASMLLYFQTHFSKNYPAPFLWFVGVALWGAFGAKAMVRAVLSLGAFVSIGEEGARRRKLVREFAARRISR